MSQANVEIVRRLYAAAARRDRAKVLSLYEGKVVRVVWFPTRAEALDAAGIEE